MISSKGNSIRKEIDRQLKIYQKSLDRAEKYLRKANKCREILHKLIDDEEQNK